MKHHPGIRSASNHKTRASSPGFRARTRDEETEVIPGWTNTGMGRVRLPHIYRFYLSLTALPCRSRHPRTYSRVVRDEERRERRREGKARQDKIYHDDPRNGTVTSGCGTSVDTPFFVSRYLSRILRRCSMIRLITLTLPFVEIQYLILALFFTNINSTERKRTNTM